MRKVDWVGELEFVEDQSAGWVITDILVEMSDIMGHELMELMELRRIRRTMERANELKEEELGYEDGEAEEDNAEMAE